MPGDLVISFPSSDTELAEVFKRSPDLGAIQLPGAGMDGGGELLVLLVPLTHFAIKTLTDLLKAHWERAKHVKIEIDGMKFNGASLDEVSAFLDRHPHRHDPN
jgi:hypothetical protein